MKLRMNALAVGLGCSLLVAPAFAQYDSVAHRQHTKNEWRNVAIAAAALAGYGLVNNDSTLTLIGLAGAAYSANRYEMDRRSQRDLQSGHYRYRAVYRRRAYRPSIVFEVVRPPRYIFVDDDDREWRHDNGHHYGWYKHGRGHGRPFGSRGHEHGEDRD